MQRIKKTGGVEGRGGECRLTEEMGDGVGTGRVVVL